MMQNPTDVFLFVVGAVALGWEMWTVFNKRPHDTISETFFRLKELPWFTLAAGFLLGHLFW